MIKERNMKKEERAKLEAEGYNLFLEKESLKVRDAQINQRINQIVQLTQQKSVKEPKDA